MVSVVPSTRIFKVQETIRSKRCKFSWSGKGLIEPKTSCCNRNTHIRRINMANQAKNSMYQLYLSIGQLASIFQERDGKSWSKVQTHEFAVTICNWHQRRQANAFVIFRRRQKGVPPSAERMLIGTLCQTKWPFFWSLKIGTTKKTCQPLFLASYTCMRLWGWST